jgi:hypothetical protein
MGLDLRVKRVEPLQSEARYVTNQPKYNHMKRNRWKSIDDQTKALGCGEAENDAESSFSPGCKAGYLKH